MYYDSNVTACQVATTRAKAYTRLTARVRDPAACGGLKPVDVRSKGAEEMTYEIDHY